MACPASWGEAEQAVNGLRMQLTLSCEARLTRPASVSTGLGPVLEEAHAALLMYICCVGLAPWQHDVCGNMQPLYAVQLAWIADSQHIFYCQRQPHVFSASGDVWQKL